MALKHWKLPQYNLMKNIKLNKDFSYGMYDDDECDEQNYDSICAIEENVQKIVATYHNFYREIEDVIAINKCNAKNYKALKKKHMEIQVSWNVVYMHLDEFDFDDQPSKAKSKKNSIISLVDEYTSKTKRCTEYLNRIKT